MSKLRNRLAKFEPETFQESLIKHSIMCDQLDLRKQRDYGTANIKQAGKSGVLTRINDKIQRLRNLMYKKGVAEWLKQNAPEVYEEHKDTLEPQNETVRDSFEDARNYAEMALMLDDNEFDLPLDSRNILEVMRDMVEKV